MPFISLFYDRRGLSGAQIGWLAAVGSLVTLLAAPFWGRWSDRAKRPLRLLQVSLVISAVLLLVQSQLYVFGGFVIIAALLSLVGAGGDPLSNDLALRVTENDSRSGFGSVRLWGSLGWALTVLLGGWMIERTGLQSGFYANAATFLICALLLGFMWWPGQRAEDVQNDGAPQDGDEANTSPGEVRQSQAGTPPSVSATLRALIKDKALVALAAATTLRLLTTQWRWAFEPLYMSQLGAGESMIGLTNSLGAVVELPAMLLADRLARRFGSHWVLKAALLLYALQMGLVVFFPGLPAIYAHRVLGGLSFSFQIVAGAVFIAERAPLQQRATILALYGVTLRSLVVMAAGPLGGFAYDQVGAYWLYAVGMAGCLLAWLILQLAVSGRRSQPAHQ